MPEATTTTTTDTTQTAADAAVAASTAATATTATDVWKAPESKEALDKLVQDAVAAEAAKYQPPKEYAGLKLPDGSPVDKTVVERTAAIARELGLSQDNAQKALGFVAGEVAAQTAAALSAYSPPSDALPEGGAKWREQDTAWKAAALVDKDLGNGDPEQLKASATLAKKVLAKFGDDESIGFIDSALGSNPAVLRVLVRIGKAMGEQALVKPVENRGTTPKSDVEVFYPKGANRTAEEINAETASG